MLVLVNIETGNIIQENSPLSNPDGTIGTYTGCMAGHPRNIYGLVFIQNGKEWDDSYIPNTIGCKLLSI